MILIILFVSLILRIILIDQSLWLDEAIEILAVKNNTYWQLITSYSLGDFHPPMYHLILKFWTGVFGYSEIGARSLSVVVGVLTVGVVFLIGRQIKNVNFGLLSALLLATSPLHIYYSQEARMYALTAFFVICGVLFFLKLLEKFNFTNSSLFIISTFLTLYTDYLPYFMILVFNIYVFWQRKKLGNTWIKGWIIVQLLILILILPWSPFFIKQLQIGNVTSSDFPIWRQTVGGFDIKALPLTLVKFIFGKISFYNKIIYGLISTFAGGVFIFLIFKNFASLKKEKLLFLWLLIPTVVGFFGSLFLPVYSYFRFLFVLPAMYLLVANGIVSLEKNLKFVAIILILSINLGSIFYFWITPRFHREGWKQAVLWIEQNANDSRSASVFVTNNQSAPYQYYAKKVLFYGPEGWEAGNYQQIYLMRYVQPIFDPNDNLKSNIESKGYKKIEEKDFNGVTIWYYQI
jgi:uncharacterized membrane protein